MIEEAQAAGLRFRDGVFDSLRPDPLGVLHNSYKGAFSKLRSRPRSVDAMTPTMGQRFHASALARQAASPIAHPAYHPTFLLQPGQSKTVDVFADTRWNETGIYLEAGAEYRFSATGEWLDKNDACDWHGTEDDKLTPGDLVRGASSFLGRFESIFADRTKNKSTDFLLTKRVEAEKWFVLIGAIANDGGAGAAVSNDGSPVPHQYVALPDYENASLRIEKPGYLYCFPNDVWSFYDNNHGGLRLTVSRVA